MEAGRRAMSFAVPLEKEKGKKSVTNTFSNAESADVISGLPDNGNFIHLLRSRSQEVIMIVIRMETPATSSQGTRRLLCSDQIPAPRLAEDHTNTMSASRATHISHGCRDTVISGNI